MYPVFSIYFLFPILPTSIDRMLVTHHNSIGHDKRRLSERASPSWTVGDGVSSIDRSSGRWIGPALALTGGVGGPLT